MNVVLRISLRNLLRQKRRNILLGAAMAFGTMILVIASSFSHGISDVLLNKIVVYVSGHVSVGFSEHGDMYRQVFHDGEWIIDKVKNELSDITHIQEALGFVARAVGNGKADNVVMVGVDLQQKINVKKSEAVKRKEVEEFKRNFKLVEGNFADFSNPDIENPVAVSLEKATYLNIRKGDVLRVRFSDIHGQRQAARLTVVAIFKSANTFMSFPVFLELSTLKRMAGYGPHDIASLYLRITDAKKFAARDADKLHAALQPRTAVIFGSVTAGTRQGGSTEEKKITASLLGFRGDTTSQRLLGDNLPIVQGDPGTAFDKDGFLISESLAASLGAQLGDTVVLTYTSKHDSQQVALTIPVKAVFKSDSGREMLLVNEKALYGAYYTNWPEDAALFPEAYIPQPDEKLYPAFDPEWQVLKRAHSSDDVRKQVRKMASTSYKGTVVDVESMYERASDVLKLEAAFNLITFVAVLILFFIIIIGVVNTLRMTIRERTREIGTIRAIGMQKDDVRDSFIYEMLFLGFFSAIAGTVLAFVAMSGLSLITFNAEDNPMGMLLVNNHLNFLPSIGATAGYIFIIVSIAMATAYFPARRAANLSASEALRHYE
jgi:ABC-type lipoprotein release transport system permease subunit